MRFIEEFKLMPFCHLTSAIFAFFVLFSFDRANCISFVLTIKEIDALYSQLLNLPNEQKALENELPKKEMKLKLELALFYDVSHQIFVSMKNKKLTNVQQKLIEEKRVEFSELAERIEKTDEWTAEIGKCKLWKFWHHLKIFLAEILGEEFGRMILESENTAQKMIDCEQIEQMLSKNDENGIGSDEQIEIIKKYLEDTKSATHFKALMALMEGQKKGENWQNEGKWHWYDNSNFFENKKLKFESNVAFQLRKMRIENNEKAILEFKSAVEQLIGPILLSQIENRHPFLMAFDLVTNAKWADEYLLILSKETIVAGIGEFRISSRIYFSRIFEIFQKFYLLQRKYLHKTDAKISNIFKEIEEKWEENINMFSVLFKENKVKDISDIVEIFDFWQKLALLYNKMPMLEAHEKIQRVEENAKVWHSESHLKILFARMELVDEHAQNVLRFYAEFLAPHLQNSLFESTGALYRLKKFLCPKQMEKFVSFGQLTQKYPQLKEILRRRLNTVEIMQLQMVNYISLFDFDTAAPHWKQSQFLLDNLAYYIWFKEHSKNLTESEQKDMEENYAKMEICMDSANTFTNLEILEEIRLEFLQRMNKIWRINFLGKKTFFFGDYGGSSTDGQKSILKSVFAMHEQSLKPLLLVNQFRQKLKEIYIDTERIGGELHENSAVFSIIKELCLGVLYSDEEKNMYKLLKKYFLLLIRTSDEPISEEEKQKFNIETYKAKNEIVVANLLKFVSNLNAENERQLIWIVSEAATELANLGLIHTKRDKSEEELGEESIGEKLRKICYFESFSFWLANNGTMLKSEKWRKFILQQNYVSKEQIAQLKPLAEKDLKWSEKNCENELVHQKMMQDFTESSCEFHFSLIISLSEKFPELTKFFATNAWSLPKLRNFVTLNADEQIELYNLIFDSDEKTSREAETKLAMKQLIGIAKEKEENLLKNPKIVEETRNAKAHTFTMMALSETFCPSKEWPVGRMLCPLGQYVQFLSEMAKNRPKVKWIAPTLCFSCDIDEIIEWQRSIFKDEMVAFFKKHLKTATNGKDDGILRILREKPGAFNKLQHLIGLEPISDLWTDLEIREKLRNEHYFSNKSRILHNYRRAMAKSSSPIERLRGRLAADITAMANHLSAQFPNEHRFCAASSAAGGANDSPAPPFASAPNPTLSSLSQLVDFVWIDFRIFYDLCDSFIPLNFKFNYNRLSLYQSKYFSELHKFIQNEIKKRSKNAVKKWNQCQNFVQTISELDWVEEEGETIAQPLELVQQMHFETVKKHLYDEEIGREMREIFLGCPNLLQIGSIFLQISSKAGNEICDEKNYEKKYYRKDLLQFLKMENIKKLFEMNGITFNENEFVMNKTEGKEKSMGRNETNGKKNKKRKMQKRKKKEEDKKEQTEEEKEEEKETKEKEKEYKKEQTGEEKEEEKEKKEEEKEDKKEKEEEKEEEKEDKKEQTEEEKEDSNLISDKRSGKEESKNEQKMEEDAHEKGNSNLNYVLLEHENLMAFVERYSNFIVINCVAEQKNVYDNLCKFLKGKIRTKLMDKIEIKNINKIEIGVMDTEANREVTLKIVDELVNRGFSINFGKVWLFGIKIPANGNENLKEHLMNFDIEMKMEYLQQLGLLSVEMDETEIINEFQKLGANVLSTVAKKWFLMDILEDKNNWENDEETNL